MYVQAAIAKLNCKPVDTATVAVVVGMLIILLSSAAAGGGGAVAASPWPNFPYGVDFPNAAATGRFCNGKTFSSTHSVRDLLGLDYFPPFATTTHGLNGTSLFTGVNYASAAGGILDETGQHLGERFCLSQQVLNLDTIRTQMEGGLEATTTSTTTSSSPQSLPSVAGTALYGVGLRKFLLDGVGPLGCLPSLRASGLGPLGQCVDQVNQMVGFFNQGLRSLVDQLNSDHPDAMFIYGNTYDAVYDMINNPHKYGFSGCCVLGEDGTCEPYAEPCEICSS
uniref:GDSL esterase/lipase n=1 Tax=Oryza meridionalis TaxID=40149 RepID=A0A0E0CD67_9ORYZ